MPEILVTLGDNVVKRVVFDKDVISIGRSRDNDIVIENLAVSRNHARIRRENNSFILRDLNSANGTFVNGVRVTKTELFNDDVITIGKHKLIFKNEALSDEALISDAFGAERTMLLETPPVARLVVTRGKQKGLEFRLDKAEVTIGRSPDCEVCIHDWFVSKKHAVIHRQGSTFLLRDAGSWRGTKVNDLQVTETVLREGDVIQIGGTKIEFHLVQEPFQAPRGRVPVELGATGAVPRQEIQPPPEAAGEPVAEHEETPIRAGGVEDFIEPSAPVSPAGEGVPETEDVEPQGPFGELEEELREGAEMVSRAVGKIEPVFEGEPEPAAKVPEESESPAPEEPEEKEGGEEAQGEAAATGPSELPLDEIRLWEQALANKSPIIRRQAAKMLKKLTGKDYDY